MTSSETHGPRRVASALKIFGCLTIGLALGVLFPRNPIVLWIGQSGTWFPRTVVTVATAIIFILMSAALAKTLLTHTRSGRFLLVVVGLYVLMGGVSLLYVSAWIPVLTGLPLRQPGQALPGVSGWLKGTASLATVFTEQPLLQVLVAGFVAGTNGGHTHGPLRRFPVADAARILTPVSV